MEICHPYPGRSGPRRRPPKKNLSVKFKIFHQQPNNTLSRLLKISQSSKGEAEPGEAGGALGEFTSCLSFRRGRAPVY
jgi:hypothetical protein